MKQDSDNGTRDKGIKALNESIEHLDARTLSRLNQARQAALSLETRAPLKYINWIPAAALSALSVVAIVGSLLLSSPETGLENLDEAEFMASDEDIALMEDLEFIVWLIEEEHAG